MTHPQQAYETLDQFRQLDWPQRRAAETSNLPIKLQNIALALMGIEDNGEFITEYEKRSEGQNKAIKQLAALNPRKRAKIFQVLFPQFSDHVEATWQLFERLPYQIGGQRKAFRAPELVPNHTARNNWLIQLTQITSMYEQDVIWLATWAAFLGSGYRQDVLGTLFAGAIDSGSEEGQQVFEILKASAYGEHEIGKMGRHVTRAFLIIDDQAAWEAIEKLLIAAQRQEGLRQIILETIDEAHPEAFKRFIRLIRENDLTRFSSVIRAVDVWFGFQYDALKQKEVDAVLAEVSSYLEDAALRDEMIRSGEPQSTFLALWALATEDAMQAVSQASFIMLKDPDPERRFVGVHISDQIGLAEVYKRMIAVLEDEDMRVVARALHALGWQCYQCYHNSDRNNPLAETELFEALEQIIPHLPEEKTYGPMIWPWMTITIERRAVVSRLMSLLGDRSPQCLIPYLNELDVWGRCTVAELLRKSESWDDLTRQILFEMVADRSQRVRKVALAAIQGIESPTIEETQYLEGLLCRKSSDMRRGVIRVLLKQPDSSVLASATRLMEASKAPQREAGLEILRQMVENDRQSEQCWAMAKTYAQTSKNLSAGEASLIELLSRREEDSSVLEDGLGLFNPAERTPPTMPQLAPGKGSLVSDAAIACIQSLDDLIHEYRQEPVQVEMWNGRQQTALLGDLNWYLPRPNPKLPRPENLARLPLVDIWQSWNERRRADLRDEDDLELLRALAHLRAGQYRPGYSGFFQPHDQTATWRKKLIVRLAEGDKREKNLRYPIMISCIIEWLFWMQPPSGVVELLIDNIEITFGLIPQAKLHEKPDRYNYYFQNWRGDDRLMVWLGLANWHRNLYPEQWQAADHIRFYGLLRWLDEPYEGLPRHRPPIYDVLLAYRAGGATLADVYEQVIGPRRSGYYWYGGFNDLRMYSSRKKQDLMLEFPVLEEIIDNCRRRIIEVELNRGDLPTAASAPALNLRWSGGVDTLICVLKAMGRTPFVRGWVRDSDSKKSVFSHLIRATYPVVEDTPEQFAELAREAQISEKRLIEVALYAPQWADYVQATLGWSDFAEAVWWIVAHTKDSNWQVDQDIRETWAAEVSQLTPLSGANLLAGAVDVAWFWRIYESLGDERWGMVYKASKYTSSSGGHKRAQLFADALMGQVTVQEIEQRVTEKRHKDALRALGLLPLHPGDGREDDLLHRYEVIQEFKRSSRKFGAQRQESEGRAVEIALENLARNAGWPDPQRLTWAMEKQAVGRLANGPVTTRYENYTVTLSIDIVGSPELSIINEKTGRKLKNLPGRARKDPEITELREMASYVRKQVSRMRRSLEDAMVRGDEFTFAEVVDLLDHSVLRPMLEQLVFVGVNEIGYPIKGQNGLQFYDGATHPVVDTTKLRIAHPYDLLQTGEWDQWQRECFLSERIQPFKQVFRELYILTQNEEDAHHASRRYAGHQVNPKQAIALLTSQGWVNHYEEGARKTFHDEGITAWVSSLAGGYTPAEVEGLTIETVVFTRRGEWKPMPLKDVSPTLFSEVMRDLDLVVSVAHVGGVDPEASASTVEMRAALIRETCLAIKLVNVTLSDMHAAIQGELGSYSVHLGSGVVHRQPGGVLCLIPVHSQHRGRIFLPFADDDPKTAEVLSKIILLARDQQIQDPTILEQILAR